MFLSATGRILRCLSGAQLSLVADYKLNICNAVNHTYDLKVGKFNSPK